MEEPHELTKEEILPLIKKVEDRLMQFKSYSLAFQAEKDRLEFLKEMLKTAP